LLGEPKAKLAKQPQTADDNGEPNQDTALGILPKSTVRPAQDVAKNVTASPAPHTIGTSIVGLGVDKEDSDSNDHCANSEDDFHAHWDKFT